VDSSDEFHVTDWSLAGFILAHGRNPIRVDLDSSTLPVIVFEADAKTVAETYGLRDRAIIESYRGICRMVRAAQLRANPQRERGGR